MAAPAEVYARQLIAKGYGYPMWVPEPPCRPGEVPFEVQIGDVGVIDSKGAFYRLFNAMHHKNDLINGGRVPVRFQPLVLPNHAIQNNPNFLEPGPICSESVRKVDIGVDASAVTPGGYVGASYRFTCDQNQGALLVLKDHANREQAMAENILDKYIAKHCQSWHTFATGPEHGLNVKLNDIFLVGGWIKTSAWAVAAFRNKGTTHEVSIGTGDGPYPKFNASASVAKNVSTSVDHRSGPVQSPAAPGQVHAVVRDQCIFLDPYKAKRRRLRDAIPFKMKAAAEPTDDHRPPTPDHDAVTSSSSMDSDEDIMCAQPVVMSFRDPLEDILDYILEYSDADIAVTSQSCLRKLSLLAGHEAHTHDIESLQQCLPEICVDEQRVGTLRLPNPSTAQQEVGHIGAPALFESSAHAQATPPQTYHIQQPVHSRWKTHDNSRQATEYLASHDFYYDPQHYAPHATRHVDKRCGSYYRLGGIAMAQPTSSRHMLTTEGQPYYSQPQQPYGSYLPMTPPQLYRGDLRSPQPPRTPRDAQFNTTEYHSQDGSHRNTPHATQYTTAYANNGYRQDGGADPQRTYNHYAQDYTQQTTQAPVYARPGDRPTVTTYGGHGSRSTVPASGHEQRSSSQVPPAPAPSNATPAHGLEIKWTTPAQQQLAQMTAAQCRGQDPRTYHEDHVRDYARRHIPEANRARILKPAHIGGHDPYEAEHIFVAYKINNKDLGTHHVYTDRR